MTNSPADYRRSDRLDDAIEHLRQAQRALNEAVLGDVDDTHLATLKEAKEQLRGILDKLTMAARR